MNLDSAHRAMMRARKRLAHSTRQHAEAETEKARQRHARRIRNAQRLEREAMRDWAEISSTEA